MGPVRTPLFCLVLCIALLPGDPVTRVETNWNLRVETPLVDRDQNRYRLDIREEAPVPVTASKKKKPYFVRTWDDAPSLRRLESFRSDELLRWRVDFDPTGFPARFIEYEEGRPVRWVGLGSEGHLSSDRRLENGVVLETQWRYAALESGSSQGRAAGSWPVMMIHARAGETIEMARYSWQEGVAVREERLDGKGNLVTVLTREVVKNPAGRLVTETVRRPDGRETGKTVRTENAAGRTILSRSSSGFVEEFAWDPRDLVSRQTLRDAVHGHPVMESAWSWQQAEGEAALFSPAFRFAPVAWHESRRVSPWPGLRDRLVIRHRDGTEHETKSTFVRTNAARPLQVRHSVNGQEQARMDFDPKGRLACKTLVGAAGRVRGRYEFGWDDKSGALTSLSYAAGDGPAVRTLQFVYGRRKTAAPPSVQALRPPDLFFTWGQGLYELAKLRIGAGAGNLDLQEQDMLETLSWMERLGLERIVEYDARGEAWRMVRFVVERPTHAVRWVFESYSRQGDDEARRAETRSPREKGRGVYAQNRDELETELSARFAAFALSPTMAGETWDARSREFQERTLEFWTDLAGKKLTALRLHNRHTEAVTATRVVSGGRTSTEKAPSALDEIWRDYTETLSELKPRPKAKAAQAAPSGH
jgi:YD repeat-containing protein